MAYVIERILRRDRAILIFGLIAITLLAWGYVINLSFQMMNMPMDTSPSMDMSPTPLMPNVQAWRVEDFFFNLTMWAVMMVAMMTPSATPMILAFAGLNRRRNVNENASGKAITFLAGYMIIWFSFSAIATLIQRGFHSIGTLSPEVIRVTPLIGAIILILAGIYQFTPLKYVCLSNCRTPMSFLATEWRDGISGALIMGLRHGLYCLGCCWTLMLLLFVTGVMNLLWVALIAGYVLIEKAIPAGQWVSRAFGLVMIGWGVWLVLPVLGK
jgi:predicted metal-binding membrane protein